MEGPRLRKKFYSGVDKRAINRPYWVIMSFIIIPAMTYAGYIIYRMIRGEFQDDRTVFLTCSTTLALFLGITALAFCSSKRDQWKFVKQNRKKNYCVLKKRGLKIKYNFFISSKEKKIMIPYDKIRHVDRLDRNIKKELWEPGSSWKLRRHIPLTGRGILYPNFSHPDDIVRLKLNEEFEFTSDLPMNKSSSWSSDIIYINIDRKHQHEFMTELRKRT